VSFVNVNFSGAQRPFRLHGLSIQHLSPPLKSQLKKKEGLQKQTQSSRSRVMAADCCAAASRLARERRWDPAPCRHLPTVGVRERDPRATSSPVAVWHSGRSGGRLERGACPGHSTRSWAPTCEPTLSPRRGRSRERKTQSKSQRRWGQRPGRRRLHPVHGQVFISYRHETPSEERLRCTAA